MKSGLVAQFATAMALSKGGVRLAGDLLCESVIDEEFAGGGGTLAGRLRGDNADACAIAEGTNYAVVRATRGGHFFDLVCRAGDPMGYFSKEEVVSPAIPAGRLLGWIDTWVKRRKKVDRGKTYRDFPDPAPVQVLALEANRFDPDVPWSVPLEARIRVYFQFLPHENVAAVVREIETSLGGLLQGRSFLPQPPCGGAADRRSTAAGPRTRRRTPVDALLPRRGHSGSRFEGDPVRVRVAVRRVPGPSRVRDPDTAVRAMRRRQPQRERVRRGAVDPANGGGLPGRCPGVVRLGRQPWP